MYDVRVVRPTDEWESDSVGKYDTYEEALAHAERIATKPVYNTPDPSGVYVMIFDNDHDSPRYTSW